VYETPCWLQSLDEVEGLGGLPAAARRYVDFERSLDVEVCMVGTGAERERVLTSRELATVAGSVG
jgi:adenylosuccinate synthase